MTKPSFQHSRRWTLSWCFVAIAAVCLLFADIRITTYDPWTELGRLFSGLLNLSTVGLDDLGFTLLQTVAFALLGVTLGSVCGLSLALIFHWRWVRIMCALLRSVHEIFWALIFLQFFGLHPLTGLLALAIPYTATFAKIYAEILEEGDLSALNVLAHGTGNISSFFYARVPDLYQHFKTYTAYRMECGLRSSAILGFIGLPTLGFSLSTSFMEGLYGQVWVLLILFYVLIATMRYWLRPSLLPLYLIASVFIVNNDTELSMTNISRFFTHDIVPAPIRNGESLASFWQWLSDLLMTQALPGIMNTLVLSQIALVASAICTLLLFPLVSKQFFGRFPRSVGHFFLVIMRSTPEYLLAYILLLMWGPSMLPAIVALALHNGAIIGHLVGRYSDELVMRQDASFGLNRYNYEVLPRVYGQFLAFLFYRWEVIVRETAILGILGVATLGFYIDSAIQEIRIDRAVVLIIITALLNLAIDMVSRRVRFWLRVKTDLSIR
ncbi:PhnE/PtxC family ABC transporter permease [Leucothrix arctica]|uniref:ABC transporter permease n=1 Tax=Leucothrix arctica TaxID=1481894 RepID=A0A317CHB1_9GAMM|nr:ABC transporter permease [Leucothrix arctica]PWQ97944.1 ABC transporter permease [Leucothrix arctica]